MNIQEGWERVYGPVNRLISQSILAAAVIDVDFGAEAVPGDTLDTGGGPTILG